MNVNWQFYDIYVDHPNTHDNSHYSDSEDSALDEFESVIFFNQIFKVAFREKFPFVFISVKYQHTWEELQGTFPQGVISSQCVVPLQVHPP